MGSSIPGITEKRKKEISDKLYHNIFFNKKFREGVKKDFGEILDRGLKLLETLPNPQTLKEAEDKLNNTPRKVLNYLTPNEFQEKLLMLPEFNSL